VDYGEMTVALVNSIAPDLKITRGDVRRLEFPDEFFHGYWSLGVIEHFYEGFEPVLREIHRVLTIGGYAFVTTPSMSPLRRLKAKLGAYPPLPQRDDFYQFALPSEDIVRQFEAKGFKLISASYRSGFKGLKDESGPLKPALQKLFDSKSPVARLIRGGIDRIVLPITYHTRLHVFRKVSSSCP
jgi:SAM-dependent methyltransferase